MQEEASKKEEISKKERFKQIGEEILTVSKHELIVSMRFLELAFPLLKYQMDQSTFFMGTDGACIYYNPRFLGDRYQKSRILMNRAYLHLLFHCLFGHVYKEQDPVGGKLDVKKWNLACDIVCEYLIDQLEYPSVRWIEDDRKTAWYETLEKALPVLSAEGVYSYLVVHLEDTKIDQTELLFLVDDHFFWKCQKNQEEKKKNEEKESKQQEQNWSQMSEKIESSLETYFRAIGNKTAKLSKQLRLRNQKRVDYRSFLRKFASVSEELREDLDSFDYGFYHYGLSLYGNMPLIEELEYKEEYKIREFVIAIDTSGSCSGEMVERFIQQTFDILRESNLFGEAMEVYIIQCDNEIKDVIQVSTKEALNQAMQTFEIKGHGGTDFRPVFDYVETLKGQGKLVNLKGLLYFTDGYGIYPKKRTSYKTAFVFSGEDFYDEKVPPWAMKIVLDTLYAEPKSDREEEHEY
ncbi:MAG: hypothetical protein PWP24_823 [Clostridiales bacterium]|nr:hypothetical protein [Clostridiales bacterium]